MTATFSTNENASLERVVEKNADVQEIAEIWNPSTLDECLKWIHRNDYKKVSNFKALNYKIINL